MTIHKLVHRSDPILRTRMDKFSFENPPTDSIQLAHDLAETMIENNGLGLAANQIGLPYNAFAIKAEKIIVCFNPIIVNTSETEVDIEEGCLSYPGLFLRIKRPLKIRVRYTQPNGQVVTENYEGLTARVFQHEYDHLQGIVHTTKVSKLRLEQAERRLEKERKRGMVTGYANSIDVPVEVLVNRASS